MLSRSMRLKRVYPRACGGTFGGPIYEAKKSGLSPRLRGNVGFDSGSAGCKGSIPALAGERRPETQAIYTIRVYPRACGGTSVRSLSGDILMGLSPRLRGNARVQTAKRVLFGSIPALAGERQHSSHLPALHVVYPRACGGTSSSVNQRPCRRGLSPRLRGNV